MTLHKVSWFKKTRKCFEIVGIASAVFIGGFGVYRYWDSIDKNKSDKLYDDFIRGGTNQYLEELGKVLDSQIGPSNKKSWERKRRIYVAIMEAGIQNHKDLDKPENKDRMVEIEPLCQQESREIEKQYVKIDDLLNTKLYFLGDDICRAIREAATLMSFERPHYQTNTYLAGKITDQIKSKKIPISDAYRYWVLVCDNYRFLRELFKTISRFILKENYTTYEKYEGLQKIAKDKIPKNPEDIKIALHNLLEFDKRYLNYIKSEQPPYSKKISERGKKLCVAQLLQFFEKYFEEKKRTGKMPYVTPLPESRICTVLLQGNAGRSK